MEIYFYSHPHLRVMHKAKLFIEALIHTFTLSVGYSVGRGKVTGVLVMKTLPRAEL